MIIMGLVEVVIIMCILIIIIVIKGAHCRLITATAVEHKNGHDASSTFITPTMAPTITSSITATTLTLPTTII
jgi:hypothetical protein